MDNENKCCGTCYWHKKCCGEFQCFNESAEGFAIETAYDDGKRSRYQSIQKNQSIQKRQGIISALSVVWAEIKGGRG